MTQQLEDLRRQVVQDPLAVLQQLKPGECLIIPDRWFVEMPSHVFERVKVFAANTPGYSYGRDDYSRSHVFTRVSVELEPEMRRLLE